MKFMVTDAFEQRWREGYVSRRPLSEVVSKEWQIPKSWGEMTQKYQQEFGSLFPVCL